MYIGFRNADKSVEVEVAVGGTKGSTADDVFQYFDDAPAEEVDGPHPVTLNGLSGHNIYFCSEDREQYVVVLDIGGFKSPEGKGYDRLEVTLTIDGGEDIKAAATDPAFVSLLESIRVDSEEA
ncbi:MAG: hypothetical protein LUG93_05970 [Lachnospiraceae bacterium]|nr:hypothetical protein [Lachnospiraceae bacterium]